MEEYILVLDNNGHWYVIPDDKEEQFHDWTDIDSEDERSWVVPDYAKSVGGSPSLVKFKNYRIE